MRYLNENQNKTGINISSSFSNFLMNFPVEQNLIDYYNQPKIGYRFEFGAVVR